MKIKKYKTTKTDASDFFEITNGNLEICIQREDFKKGNDEPSVYFVDVFDINIEDNDEAYLIDLSGNFDELWEAVDHLQNELNIPKKITNQIIKGGL